ncbi:sensor histidine kinase [Corynebacterium xerosis]|uniref:histidine kinase n=1 Tax=Corynebacterium xerosis TaxID=1725 RepID=A0A7X9XU47_9CORY|nr:HAMP domain-containing sensor histidine kinase [Corynebacterium xerosis]NMF10294.1 HAMP domain-containing histidine kinase [Corynebacterium xerosis]
MAAEDRGAAGVVKQKKPGPDAPAATADAEPLVGSKFSARWRIVMWIMVLLGIVLFTIILTTRTIMLSDVEAGANAQVEQEVEEFRRFAVEGIDPETGEPFDTSTRLFEVFLSRQIPEDDEVIAGIVGDRVMQIDRGTGPEGLGADGLIADGELLRAVRDAGASSGILESEEYGRVHWGTVALTGDPDSDHLVVAAFTSAAREGVHHQVRIISVVAVGGLLLTLLIAWLVAGQILAPVREVRRVAARIQDTDLSQRVPVTGRDDIAELALTFNGMLDRLETSYATQRRFIDDAGHELRTPITVIRGQLELLEGASGEERERSIRLATTELDRMSRIVSELLTLARAERSDFVVPEATDVADLTLELESKAQALGDREWLVEEIAESTAVIDPEKIMQAMLQIASNAVDHTEEGSAIRIGSRVTGSGDQRLLRLWITDSGPGLSAYDARHVFDRFSRGTGGGAKRNKGGAGLGLSIVKAIADAHRGSAWVTSKEVEGATFGLELPAGPAPATPRDAGDAGGAGASPGESWAIDPGSENRTRPDDPDPPTNPFPPVNPDAAQNAGPDSAPGATEPTTTGPAGNPNTTDPTTSNPTTTDPKEPS